MIAVVGADDAPGVPARVHRLGVRSARQQLQAGKARRHRAAVAAAQPRAGSPTSPATGRGAASPGTEQGAATPGSPAARSAVQRAGVRAALAELRRHRPPEPGDPDGPDVEVGGAEAGPRIGGER